MKYILCFLLVLLSGCTSRTYRTYQIPEDKGFIIKNKHKAGWANDRFPLPVYIDLRYFTAYQAATIVKSIGYWETRTGLDLFDIRLFLPGVPVVEHSIVIHAGNTNYMIKKGLAGLTRFDYCPSPLFELGVICHADVALNIVESDKHFWAVVVHELGHTLGLDHDTYRDSIMYYMPLADCDITQHDVYLLRRRLTSRLGVLQ